MRHSLYFIGTFAAASLVSFTAAAEQLGDHGTVAIGVDRLFGFAYHSVSYKEPNGTGGTNSYDETISNFSFLGRGTGIPFAVPAALQVPRLGADVFLGPGVSLGGSIAYDYYSTGETVNGQDTNTSDSTGIWIFSPRIGFAKMFSDNIGIWPRAGITYAHIAATTSTTDPATGTTTSQDQKGHLTFLTLEVNLLLAPVQHFMFTVGPSFDYLLSFSPTGNTGQTDYSGHSLGLHVGMLGWL